VSAAQVAIVGLLGGQWFGRAAEAALREADVLLGHARQFALLAEDIKGERVESWGDLAAVVDQACAARDEGRRACILAAGDPGFHGMVRFAVDRLGADGVAVHPAPSSVALAFARLGEPWDDASVVSLHGQPLDATVAAVQAGPKVAVLVSKRQPAEALGRALLDAGCEPRDVAVCTRLAEPDEAVVRTDLVGLAAGPFDDLSVVVVCTPR
jgi:precorrin-6B C5,15-methyltransferase / cobalt-precorrin-6B C5,C15-methyltransferase